MKYDAYMQIYVCICTYVYMYTHMSGVEWTSAWEKRAKLIRKLAWLISKVVINKDATCPWHSDRQPQQKCTHTNRRTHTYINIRVYVRLNLYMCIVTTMTCAWPLSSDCGRRVDISHTPMEMEHIFIIGARAGSLMQMPLILHSLGQFPCHKKINQTAAAAGEPFFLASRTNTHIKIYIYI